jgi:hypothetical protein
MSRVGRKRRYTMRREKRKPMAMDIAQKSACSSSHAVDSDDFARCRPSRCGRRLVALRRPRPTPVPEQPPRPEPSRLARRPPCVARLVEPRGGRERLRTGNERVRKRQKEEEIKKGRTKRKGK